MKQNPFSFYDFMGYFVPGATTMYLVYIIGHVKESKCFNITYLLTTFPKISIEGILIFLILSYVLGHLISFISSMTVETYSIWKYGYPSKYLLNMHNTTFWSNTKKFHSIFWRVVIIIVLLPTIALDTLLGYWFGFKIFYHKKLDSVLIKFIKHKTNKLLCALGMTEENGFKLGEANQSEFFLIIMHYTYENSKNHQSKLNNYVALYGFLRTFTLISNILFWYFILHTLLYGKVNLTSIVITIFISLISYLFFMAFMKFYRRYTLEALMILAIDKDMK